MGGYSATQIYQMFQQGQGPGHLYYAQDGATVQQGAQDDVSNQIMQLNQKMAAAWGGNASEAAQTGAVPLANAAQDANNALAQHQAVISNQADAFNTARNSVTNVPSQMPNNVGNDVLAVLGDSGPLDNQVTQYNASSQHNVQVYQTYAQTSSATAAEIPQSYGQIPASNATITVVSSSSVGAGSPRYAASSIVGGGSGAAAAEQEYAASRLAAPPSAGEPGGTQLSSASEGSLAGTIDAPPGGEGSWRLPGLPNEPSFTTSVSGWVPPGETEVSPVGGFPGALRAGNSNEEQNPNQLRTPSNPNFSGDLAAGNSFVGPGGVGGIGPGGEDKTRSSGSGRTASDSAKAASSLHGGSGSGGSGKSGANPSATTNSSRSGVGTTASAQESMMATGMGVPGGVGHPGGAAGEGAMPMGGMGAGSRGEEDSEHRVAQYLQEADPDALFGTDEATAPPVIGE